MTLSWKIGRVAGIDLYLHPTLFLLPLFLGMDAASIALTASVFGCVLLHELGHALTARRLGIGTHDITLYPIGGVARLTRMPKKPGPELLIALAGPAVNLAIAGVLAVVLGATGSLDTWAGGPIGGFGASLLSINLGLALFNLIPAFPMDGGRVLRAALSGPLGRSRATAVAATIGQGLALAFAAYGLYQGQILHAVLAAFVYFAAGQERAAVREEESSEGPGWGRFGPLGDRPDSLRLPQAPPGFAWMYGGGGRWRLAPIVLTVDERSEPPRWTGR